MHTHTYTHMHIHTYTHIHTHMHTHTDTCTHTHTHIHTYTCIHTHTHTHTHTQAHTCTQRHKDSKTLLLVLRIQWCTQGGHSQHVSPYGSNEFYAVLEKISMLVPSPGGLAPPPAGNPGSAPGMIYHLCKMLYINIV